jgi:hypothetical protein
MNRLYQFQFLVARELAFRVNCKGSVQLPSTHVCINVVCTHIILICIAYDYHEYTGIQYERCWNATAIL